jgi:SEC-C motif-containing protein
MNPRDRSDPACPCGSGLHYAACCGRWHEGPQHLQAPTAEALMRSRYSAYVRELGNYLHDTWHPSTRPAQPPEFEPGLRWLGLEVKRHTPQGADRAEVQFVTRSKLGGRAHRLQECSRFVCEAGRWYYLDGTQPGASDGPPVSIDQDR